MNAVDTDVLDIFIIGGGVNGCGIARDAAGRGFSVMLAEKDDLASGTSSGSTKLVHGGLRYLEYYEFHLVRESLMEREVLWAMAPHIIWPLRFVLPLHKAMRPAWLIRLGLFLYDHIGGRKALPGTRTLDLTRDPAGPPLKPQFVRAFEYSDCWVNDARLVVLNARDAADRGAMIRTRTEVVAARRIDGIWEIETRKAGSGETSTRRARMLVNAAGPWVDEVIAGPLGHREKHHVRLVQGSHIVVKRKFRHDRAYFFQNNDGRIFFAIPYETDFTLIGTTDRDYEGDPGEVRISEEETEYLCHGASEYFREPVRREDIVWTYSAVRPLYDDGASAAQAATRDFVLKTEEDGALLNVFGGKITTFRRLSQDAMKLIEAKLGARGKPWTAGTTLPGGDFPMQGFSAQVAGLSRDYPFLEEWQARRLMRLYGTVAREILGEARTFADLGRHFGAGLTEREVVHLMDKEWARTAKDVLWRRTKRGLRFSPEEAEALDRWMAARRT